MHSTIYCCISLSLREMCPGLGSYKKAADLSLCHIFFYLPLLFTMRPSATAASDALASRVQGVVSMTRAPFNECGRVLQSQDRYISLTSMNMILSGGSLPLTGYMCTQMTTRAACVAITTKVTTKHHSCLDLQHGDSHSPDFAVRDCANANTTIRRRKKYQL